MHLINFTGYKTNGKHVAVCSRGPAATRRREYLEGLAGAAGVSVGGGIGRGCKNIRGRIELVGIGRQKTRGLKRYGMVG